MTRGETGDAVSIGSDRDQIGDLLDHLFRRESGRLVAMLTARLGPSRLDLAEEVVQEALVKALRQWPFEGVPREPSAWLYRVACNLAVDRLRRVATFRKKEATIRQLRETRAEPPRSYLAGEITGDQLRMLFLCCHPSLSRESRLALTLKLVGGFSVPEIARAFLAKEATLFRRLARATQKLRQVDPSFELPPGDELLERVDAVLEAIYLTFNGGYGVLDGGRGGDRLVRRDVCAEALRFVEQLLDTESSPIEGSWRPRAHALAALSYFQFSRLAARVDAEGEMVRLVDQDRASWDRRAIARAFFHLERAAAGDSVSSYHVQAAIASHHARTCFGSHLDWAAILELYDQLLVIDPSPVVALNRAVALSFVRGSERALHEVERLADDARLETYYLLHATRADLASRSGRRDLARVACARAAELAPSRPERRFLERRLRELEDPQTPADEP